MHWVELWQAFNKLRFGSPYIRHSTRVVPSYVDCTLTVFYQRLAPFHPLKLRVCKVYTLQSNLPSKLIWKTFPICILINFLVVRCIKLFKLGELTALNQRPCKHGLCSQLNQLCIFWANCIGSGQASVWCGHCSLFAKYERCYSFFYPNSPLLDIELRLGEWIVVMCRTLPSKFSAYVKNTNFATFFEQARKLKMSSTFFFNVGSGHNRQFQSMGKYIRTFFP